MQVIKLLGEAINVNVGLGTIVANSDGVGAQYVLLQHDHSGGQAHIVEVRTGAGVTIGSLHLAPHNPLIVQKDRTDLIYSSATDVYATSVVYQG